MMATWDDVLTDPGVEADVEYLVPGYQVHTIVGRNG